MADVPVNYRKSPEFVASYDYVDYIQNQGVLYLYLSQAKDENATDTLILTPSQYDSSSIEKSITLSTTTDFEKLGDDDYDLMVNSTFVISGTGIAEFTTAAKEWSSNGKKCRLYLIVRLRKYSGTTETEIANGKSSTNLADNDFVYSRESIKLSVTSPVKFSKGDILRITIESWIDCDSTTNAGAKYFTDPTSRYTYESVSGFTGKKTDFKVQIPLRLQN